jgi:hypothetical protein
VIAFYSGEKMRPEAIRAADPNARFKGRARTAINSGEEPDQFATVLDGEIWGIAVETSAPCESVEIEITLEDGQTIDALLAEPVLGGNPTQVLANARYWELPPDFVARLRSIVEAGLDDA